MNRTCVDCSSKFQAGPEARFCNACRPLHRGRKTTKYPLTPEVEELLRSRYDTRVRGRAAEIARQLGWPTWMVKKTARKFGLTRPAPASRRDWTAEEIQVLRTWQGLRSAKWIGRRIDRSETSVVLKFKRMRLSRRIRWGYTIGDLSRCFGVDPHTIDRWLRYGWLDARPQGTARRHDIQRVSEKSVLEFVTKHRLQYRIDRVDQDWFLGLVLGQANRTNGQE